MLLNDVFKFGKHKGQTLKSVLATEQGRDWLHWYIDQPCMNSKFADMDRTNKAAIRRKLQQQQGHLDPSDVTSTMYLAGEIEKLKERVDNLENPTATVANNNSAYGEGWED